MSYALTRAVPFMARCSGSRGEPEGKPCGRSWWQTASWPEGTILECTCGAFAEVDDCEREGCGKPATYLWRDEIPQPLEVGEVYERVELGDLHRACDEHRPQDTRVRKQEQEA